MTSSEHSKLKAYIYRLKIFRLSLLIIAMIILLPNLFYAFESVGRFLWQLEFMYLIMEGLVASILILPLHYSILRYTAYLEGGETEDQRWGKILLVSSIVLILIGLIAFFSTAGMHGIYWFIEHRLGL